MLMIEPEQYLYFANRALDGMAAIVADLGDDLANVRPALPGANSPYALLTHCLGVVSYWSGALVAGRDIDRDRGGEFAASGPVGPLLERTRHVREQLATDVAGASARAPLHARPRHDAQGPPRELDQGGALMHVYEELAQHHGQMEILRDCLIAASTVERRRS
jgi:hypothetical protein